MFSFGKVFVDVPATSTECQRNLMVLKQTDIAALVRGFIFSDCKCFSHLFFLKERLSFPEFFCLIDDCIL